MSPPFLLGVNVRQLDDLREENKRLRKVALDSLNKVRTLRKQLQESLRYIDYAEREIDEKLKGELL